MIDSEEEDTDRIISKTYADFINTLLRGARGNSVDRVDDYLIGLTRQLEQVPHQEDHRVQNTLLEALVMFPPKGAGALEGLIPGRPYSLLTLFCLVGDRWLIYALFALGISVLDFDWKLHYNHLSEEVKLILQSMRKTQRDGKTLKIPRDIQRTFQEIKERRRRDIRQRDTIPYTRSEVNNNNNEQRTGVWVGDYFVEDYELEVRKSVETTKIPNEQNPSTTPTTINVPQTSSTAHLQRKLSKLNNLKNRIITNSQPVPQQQQPSSSSSSVTTTSTLPPQIDPPSNTTIVPSILQHSRTLNLDLQSSPSRKVLLSNLPIDASPQSILFFLQNGPDIFKTARTQNQRIDALGRNLYKFKNNWSGGGGGKSKQGMIRGTTSKYGWIKEKDVEFIVQPGCQQSRSVRVHLHPPPSNAPPIDSTTPDVTSLGHLGSNFIMDFHKKKFFPLDLLSKPISCILSPD